MAYSTYRIYNTINIAGHNIYIFIYCVIHSIACMYTRLPCDWNVILPIRGRRDFIHSWRTSSTRVVGHVAWDLLCM